MAQKSQEKGVTGPAPVVDSPDRVRNVVLVGHSGAGKTTLVEALLAASATIGRAGSVTEGTTVCDHDPAAVRQQRSVALACAPILHGGVKINLLDTPGYADFVGELRAGLRAADAALFVVSAVDGVDAATVMLWEECASVGMPRAVVVTHLDRPRAEFETALAICTRLFGAGVQPLFLPLLDDADAPAGLGLARALCGSGVPSFWKSDLAGAIAELDRRLEPGDVIITGTPPTRPRPRFPT